MKRLALIVALAAATLAGCGGSSHKAAPVINKATTESQWVAAGWQAEQAYARKTGWSIKEIDSGFAYAYGDGYNHPTLGDAIRAEFDYETGV